MSRNFNSTFSGLFLAGALISSATLCPVCDVPSYGCQSEYYFECIEQNSSVPKYSDTIELSAKEQLLSLYGETRNMTNEEENLYNSFIKRISKPIGFDVFSVL